MCALVLADPNASYNALVPEVFLPGVLYPFSLLLHIYKRKDGLKGHYSNELWDRRQQMVTYLWNLYGKLWHGK